MSARAILVVVLACAGPALGYYEGTITAPWAELTTLDGPQTIEIMITGPVSIDGINLNLQIGDGAWPEYIDGPRFIDADLDGPGLLFNGATFGQTKVIITPQMLWVGTITPVAGQFINIPAGESRVLARVVLQPAGPIAYWPLSLTSLNGPTDYADAFEEKFPTLIDGRIGVDIPEPASLLMIMAGGGLALRRTRLSSRK